MLGVNLSSKLGNFQAVSQELIARDLAAVDQYAGPLFSKLLSSMLNIQEKAIFLKTASAMQPLHPEPAGQVALWSTGTELPLC